MSGQLILIFMIVTLGVLFSPIYFQNRKLRRFADEDLKQIDPAEWKHQLKWNAYSYFVGRVIWGLTLLGLFLKSLIYMTASQIDFVQVLALLFGLGCLGFGFWGLKRDKRKLAELA